MCTYKTILNTLGSCNREMAKKILVNLAYSFSGGRKLNYKLEKLLVITKN